MLSGTRRCAGSRPRAVPVLAAAYGSAFMGETLTARLTIAAVIVSAGVILGIAGRQRRS
jgi:drug/metabolite transporter (DMT)-like permease